MMIKKDTDLISIWSGRYTHRSVRSLPCIPPLYNQKKKEITFIPDPHTPTPTPTNSMALLMAWLGVLPINFIEYTKSYISYVSHITGKVVI